MTRKSIAIASLVLLLAGSAQARSPINLDVLRRDGYGVVPIKHPRLNELTVRAAINGRKVDLILDTGWEAPGSGISLDRNLARTLKLQTMPAPGHNLTWTGAPMQNEVALGNSIVLGNAQIAGVPFYFGQLAGLQSRTSFTSTGSRIVYQSSGERGFITIGFLRATSAIIDLSNSQLFLRPPGVGSRAIIGPALRGYGLAEIPMHGAPGRQFLVDGEINGVSGKMAVDTGAAVTVLDRQFASRVKARGGSMKIHQGDAAGNFRETDVAYVQSFKLGGVSVYRPDITVANTSLASYGLLGVIGMDLLGQNRGIIDCGAEKLYLGHVR